MSHIWMSRVTRMNESCHAYEKFMSHIWMSRVTHGNKSFHTYECVMSHWWIIHVTCMNESCHIYEAFISHIRMSRVSYMHQQCHAYACVMSHYRVAKTHISSRCRSFFRKRAMNCRAPLREMTYKDKASYDSTPPCTIHTANNSTLRASHSLVTTYMALHPPPPLQPRGGGCWGVSILF